MKISLTQVHQFRRGNFLVVVLGLISLLLALTIGLTVKVRTGMINVGYTTKTAQKYIDTGTALVP